MAEPKKRLTRTRSGNRQSHDALKATNLSLCSNCKQEMIPHTVCRNCGFYNGKKILTLKSEKVKQQKAQKELENE